MIKLKTSLLAIAFTLISGLLFSQVPQTFSYQAVVRAGNNALIQQKQISLRASILQGSENGNAIYQEMHFPTTNENGLISIEIGTGESEQNFSGINWSNGPYYLKTEIDPVGGSNFSIAATNKMLSVPYALYAATAGNANGSSAMSLGEVLANGNDGNSQQIKNIAYPTDDQDAATKAYTDSVFAALNFITDSINRKFSDIIDSLNIVNSEYAVRIDSMNISFNENMDSLQNALQMQRRRTENMLIESGQGFLDDRDGNVYKMVTIGNQTWMAENLRYLPSVAGPEEGSSNEPYYYVYGYDGTDIDAAKSTVNYTTYGVLYNWPAAMDGFGSSDANPSGVQGACPNGWHMPSSDEWVQLDRSLSGDNHASQLAGNADLWESGDMTVAPEFGTSGFDVLPGGTRYEAGIFGNIGNGASFWSSQENDATSAKGTSFGKDQVDGIYGLNNSKLTGYYVRCVSDEIRYNRAEQLNNTLDSLQNAMNEQRQQLEDMLVDAGQGFRDERDGNFYKMVKIGNQTWMAENLKYLPADANINWGEVSETEPYYYVCNYQGTDVEAAKATSNYSTYGVLYNWLAAMAGESSSESNPSGVQGVCPDGWHLPSYNEWMQLDNALSGENHGSQLAGNIALWTDNSDINTSEFGTSGFNALPGGQLENPNNFLNVGSKAYFWTSYGYGTSAQYAGVGIERAGGSNTDIFIGAEEISRGLSVRCVRGGAENSHSYIDLGLPSGIKWAATNVGATNPEDYGDYFAWGETTPKGEYTEDNYTYSDNPDILPASADAASVNWGGYWRMPTQAEMQELLDNCTWTWATQNGATIGYLITGTNGNSILLPADESGDAANYWTSSVCENLSQAVQLHFDFFVDGYTQDALYTNWLQRFYGCFVRPVFGASVVTSSVSNVTTSSATCGGNVISDGGLEITVRGVCWSTSEHPTVSDNNTIDGSGLGSFTSNITGLTANTTYYVRAYATNANGTVYGEQKTFTTYGTFTDTRDGNTYEYLTIGEQTWMAENLKYLPSVVGPTTGSATESYYYVYGYNGTDIEAAKATENYAIYGVLYNWPAAMDGASSSEANPSGVQGVCPSGWHLPSYAEWEQLNNAITGDNVASQLAGNVDLWESGNLTNAAEFGTSGFNALPGGDRSDGGTFSYRGFGASFWTATEEEGSAYFDSVDYNFTISTPTNEYSTNAYGNSVRCVRN